MPAHHTQVVRHASSISPHHHRAGRRAATALLLSLTLISAAPAAATPPPGAANAAVITTWNQIAVNTVTATGASPAAFNYFAFVHLAMYNAVVGITGEYELYRWDKHAPTGASPEAAAAAAAHRVLSNYFPAAATNLDAQLVASLAQVPDGGAQDKAISYGVRAANHIIALRMNDGRHAAVVVPVADAPGEWSPTPPGFAPFASAWLGGVTPIALQSTSQFAPGPPPALDSAEYLADLAEVRAIGELNSPRSAFQSETAKFFSDAGIVPMQAALREFATRRALDIDDSARMFAAVDTAVADGAGTVWKAKLQYMLWRPVTAIHAEGMTGWTSFVTNPPYPDWPSGLTSAVGATSTVLERLYGTLDLKIASAAAGAGPQPRHYVNGATFRDDAVDARVWSGIHFRFADTAGITVGTSVANYVVDNYFQPTD